MADKQIKVLEPDIDKVSLSMLGWEITNFEARLMTTDYSDGKGKDVYFEVAASAQLEFHPEDWQVRHDDGDYLPPIMWQVRSRSRGPVMGYKKLTTYLKKKQLRAPKTVTAKLGPWHGGRKSPDDLYVWVGAVDWEDIYDVSMAFNRREFPVEVLRQSTMNGVRMNDPKCVAVLTEDDGDKEIEVTVRGAFQLGTAQELLQDAIASDSFYGDEDLPVEDQDDFKVEAPMVAIDLFDATGFLLATNEGDDGNFVHVGPGGEVPRRPPTYIKNVTFDVDNLPGKPARVVVRILDPDA